MYFGDVATVSIIAPVFNEEGRLGAFLDRCLAAAEACPASSVEVIIVDDGSRDRSRDLVIATSRKHPGIIRLIELSRNFGQQAAFHAGLSLARGDLIVTLDSDLQDPPELIPRLVEKALEGFDIVYGRRVSQSGGRWGASGHTGVKALGAFVFHRLMSRLKSHSIPPDVGEYRCMSRRVVDHVLEFSESMVFLPGLVSYTGFNVAFVDYARRRRDNRAPTSMRRLAMRALDALTTFSIAPVVLVLMLAAAAWIVPIVVLTWVASALLTSQPPAVPLMWLAASLAWCVTVSMLAIIAHYVGRIFIEVKRRPRYFVRRVVEKPED